MYGHIGEHIYAKTFCADYFFGLYPKSSFCNQTNKPVLRDVASALHFITGHEQTQLNRVCYFRFFDVVPACNLTTQNLLDNLVY